MPDDSTPAPLTPALPPLAAMAALDAAPARRSWPWPLWLRCLLVGSILALAYEAGALTGTLLRLLDLIQRACP